MRHAGFFERLGVVWVVLAAIGTFGAIACAAVPGPLWLGRSFVGLLLFGVAAFFLAYLQSRD